MEKRYQVSDGTAETGTRNDNMYLFTTFEEAYTLIASPERYKGIRVRIKNEVEAFVMHRAYNGFLELLQADKTDGKEKEVNALIVGLGKHGREMLKLLVWMCQIEGYRVNITAFDKNPVTASELRAECPTLLRSDYNSHTSPLDTKYHITLYCGSEYAVSSSVFYDTLLGAYRKNPPSYVFVSLGDDKTNIATAEAVNCFFEQHRIDTDNNWPQRTDRIIHRIDTVVYNSALNHNFKDTASADNGASGNIHYIGSIESTYSRAVIVQSALETEALQLHTEVYKRPEDEFWSSHYSYRSSIATIMFAKVWHSVFDLYADDETALLRNHVETLLPFFSDASQKLLKDALDDIDKSDNDDKKQELTRVCFELFTKLVEHRRWNAYMLTEGFIPAGSKAEKSLQFKRHHLIKSFSTREELANESDPKILLDKRPEF